MAPHLALDGPGGHAARRSDHLGVWPLRQAAQLLHGPRTEPWGQTIARLLSPEGLVVGVSHTPWMR